MCLRKPGDGIIGAMDHKTQDNAAAAFAELVREASLLVEQTAHVRKRTLSLSSEVAALFAQMGPADSSAAPAGAVNSPDGPTDAVQASVAGAATEPAGAVQAGAVDSPAGPADAGRERLADWAALQAEVAECRNCGLADSRTKTVFGAGSLDAELVFVGEAPGEHEDLQGLPFVGRAGAFLTDVIEKGLKLTRDDVFICNVLKCRPPGNRDPKPDEREACEPYLIRQLALIRPKVICALGGHAAKMLLKTEAPVGQLRGKWHFYQGIPVRVTYHPSYIVRSENEPARHKADKHKVWEDIKEVIRVLNGEIAPRPASGEPGGGPAYSG